MEKITNILFFVLCLVTNSIGHIYDGMHSPSTEDLELERQINLINKPHVKSIQTKSGHIVDCVDINKQPAFDHPLLKNHKLQRKPSFEKQNNEQSVKSSSTKPIYWLENVSCPKGTIPIQRITKEDLIRGKSLFKDHSLIQPSSIIREAYVFTAVQFNYLGVKGTTSIYNPKVDKDQSSAGYLYVQNDMGDYTYTTNILNKIMVGWHVFPKLYNDGSTYFFSLWTSDNFKNKGCYNMLCNGFVQTDTSYYLGSRIAKTSTYNGEMIEMPLSLNQDPRSHNWWLTVANKTIGYFPTAIFSNMVNTTAVGWGGLTVTPAGTSSPPMGSGHSPDKDFVHASYFRYVGIQGDYSGKYYYPKSAEGYSDDDNCYGAEYYGDQGEEFGYSLQFGGPGCGK